MFFVLYAFLVARLFYWQIIKGKELSEQGRIQYQANYEIMASRGEILANDGSWLTANVRAWLVYADIPRIEEKPKIIAEKLAPYFLKDDVDQKTLLIEIDRIEALLTREGAVWVPIRHKVTNEVKNKIEEMYIKGVAFEEQQVRHYPEGSSSAHLLGFVGKDSEGDDKGYFGIEGYYDLILSGKPGFLSRESDAAGVPILLTETKEIGAIGGMNLLTNVDKAVQLSLERNLKRGIETYGASAGVVVVMNPKNGAILGMSAFPSYDPKDYSSFSDKLFSNPIVSSTFEPGSIFKVIIMASALDAKVIDPETKCDICGGPFRVDKYTIGTWDDRYYPDSSMTDVIVHSDNVGMVFVGNKLGKDLMYDYLKSFGIGELTGIDLQGEVTPKLRERSEWSIVDLATASFGQGIAVTPIQIVRAVGAIANKGVMVTPKVVDRIVRDGWSEDLMDVKGKRVISEKAAAQITSMMVEAASKGEAKWTYHKGFGIAGKTGTAQIPIAGHYDEEKTIASFVGFAPYNDPEFIMLVTLKEPQTSPWASETAAPLWYKIAEDLFLYFGVQPE